MIQRRQTLFLFQLVVLGLVLLFVPSCYAIASRGEIPVYLVQLDDPVISSTPGHLAAIYLNFAGLILASATIFLYRRLRLQLKMSYALAILWLVLALMIAFCPFVDAGEEFIDVNVNYFAVAVAAIGVIGAIVSARFIKADIELLKSVDRIR